MWSRQAVLPLIVAALMVGFATSAACSDPSGTPPTTSPDASGDLDVSPADATIDGEGGGTCSLPGSFGSAKCNECVRTHCCGELGACTSDTKCNGLLMCILRCIDGPDAGGCSNACFAAFPEAEAKYRVLETCWFFSDACTFHCAVGP